MISGTLALFRSYFTESNTIGRLFLNDVFLCYTLEKRDRSLDASMQVVDINQLKVTNRTCIPYGTYNVMVNLSIQYGKLSPLVKYVPGFSNIRILPEYTNKEIIDDGNIIVGFGFDSITQTVTESVPAFVKLMQELKSYPTINLSVLKNTNIEYV